MTLLKSLALQGIFLKLPVIPVSVFGALSKGTGQVFSLVGQPGFTELPFPCHFA